MKQQLTNDLIKFMEQSSINQSTQDQIIFIVKSHFEREELRRKNRL